MNLIKDSAQEKVLVSALADSVRVSRPGTTTQNKTIGNTILFTYRNCWFLCSCENKKVLTFYFSFFFLSFLFNKTFPACIVVEKNSAKLYT